MNLHSIPIEQTAPFSDEMKRAIMRIYSQYVTINRAEKRMFKTRVRIDKKGIQHFEYLSDGLGGQWGNLVPSAWQGQGESVDNFKLYMLTEGIIYD